MSGNTEYLWWYVWRQAFKQAERCGMAAHAIPRIRKLYAIEDTRHAHAARRPNIRGSHHQNLKL
jgi:hypothetical protein